MCIGKPSLGLLPSSSMRLTFSDEEQLALLNDGSEVLDAGIAEI
jgi:hypothetical protein